MVTSTPPYSGASHGGQVRMDALLARARARLGPRYFHGLVLATAVLVVLGTVPVQNLTQLPFWTGGFDEWWYVGVFCLIAIGSAPLVLGLILVPRHRALIAYLRGEEVDPAEVWRDCVTRLPATAALVSLAWYVVVVGAGLIFVGDREQFGPLTYLGASASHALITIGSGAFYLMIYELALLPIAAEVAHRLPAGFAERSRITGRRRLVTLNTAIIFTVGCQAAGLSYGFSMEGRALVVVLVTVGLVSTYVGLLLSLVSSSVTRRVDELADALDGVASGRTSVRILPTSGDEFDSVGRAFNTMVDLLEGHAEELRRSRARLVEVADGARRHIERDLHDGAQQNLALVSMQMGHLETMCTDVPAVHGRVHEIRAELTAVVAEMRALAHGIYPASLEAEGLPSALRAAAREADVMVRLDVSVEERWSHGVELAVYFCCWETLQRARHADCDHPSVTITLEERAGKALVALAIEPSLPATQGAELAQFLEDRLGAVGGSLRRTLRRGTIVLAGEVPLP